MIKVLDPLQDNKSRIELIDYMGSDAAVCSDARASFDKEVTELTERDRRLIDYLLKNQHFSPLRSTVFKFRVKAPIFIARQWVKHQVASSHLDEQHSYNERSFRYTEFNESEDFYIPTQFLTQSKSNKQSSDEPLDLVANETAIAIYESQCDMSFAAYRELIDLGVSREQARGVLVPSVYTTWVWTVSLQALLNFIFLRSGKGAQSEIAKYADAVRAIAEQIVPYTMESWQDYY